MNTIIARILSDKTARDRDTVANITPSSLAFTPWG